MDEPAKTPLFELHQHAGAKFIEFAGWEMPIQYPGGILAEHLAVRKTAGLFDVSHMGRIFFKGPGALAFLRFALTNDARKLEPGRSQYTFLSNTRGIALDDAFLYRLDEQQYLLVVNAANQSCDLAHLEKLMAPFEKVEYEDRTEATAMLALQGPQSRDILAAVLPRADLDAYSRGDCFNEEFGGHRIQIACTGYTGEPVGYELIAPFASAEKLWTTLVKNGAAPCGLGARDTLRLEAGLPLFGHEQGRSPDGQEIHIFAISQATKGVCFEDSKRQFHGQKALADQFEALNAFQNGDFALKEALPQKVLPVAVIGPQAARTGDILLMDSEEVGIITSGTAAPYWTFEGGKPADESRHRPVAMALLDSQIAPGRRLDVRIRNKDLPVRTIPSHIERKGRYIQARVYTE